MASRKLSAKWGVYFISLTVVLIFYLGIQLFDGVGGILLGAGLVLLVVTVSIAGYLARPSVREALGMIFALFHAHRAMIRGNYARAEGYLGKALTQAENCGVNRDTFAGTALCELGEVYRTQGRLAEAEPVLQRALRHWEEAEWSETPNATKARRNRAVALCNLAALYINQGRFAEAELLCRDALAIFDDDPTVRPGNMAVALHNLALVLAGQGNYAEAERLSREALARIPRDVQRGTMAGCVVLSSLADLCRRQGRTDEAEPLARRAVALFEKSIYGPDHPHHARFLNVLAETLREQGDLEEAESLCRRSQALTEKAFGPDHPRLDGCLATLARIRIGQDRAAEAEPLLRRCLSILDAAVVADHPDRLARREECSALLRQLGRPTEEAQWGAESRATAICTDRPQHVLPAT